MLGQRRRRWHKIKLPLGERPVWPSICLSHPIGFIWQLRSVVTREAGRLEPVVCRADGQLLSAVNRVATHPSVSVADGHHSALAQ